MNDSAPIAAERPMPAFEIVLPAGMHKHIREFLFCDPSREYMGVILAGVSETQDKVKLLGRQFIPVTSNEYEHQSAGGLSVRREFSQRLLQRCATEGLSQIDVHSHPFGPSPNLWFSGTDDEHEQRMAAYIYARLRGSLYASLVMNQSHSRARLWLPTPETVRHHEIQTLVLADYPFQRLRIASKAGEDEQRLPADVDAAFARQVLAFGAAGQHAMEQLTVGVVGAGGLGASILDGLSRLGFTKYAIIDPDIAEASNLNRVAGMNRDDVAHGRYKTEIACRNIRAVAAAADIREIRESVFSSNSIEHLKACDLIVVATDNHATRLLVQRVGVQYLIPVISVGVNIEASATGSISDISGEYAIALPGAAGWCLSCARAYDPEAAAIELADAAERKRWIHRGYISGADVKAPSVGHLNAVVAGLAVAEIHNLCAPYKRFVSYMAYDHLAGELMSYTIVRDPTCAICSDSALLGLGDVEPLPDYEREPSWSLLPASDSNEVQDDPLESDAGAPLADDANSCPIQAMETTPNLCIAPMVDEVPQGLSRPESSVDGVSSEGRSAQRE